MSVGKPKVDPKRNLTMSHEQYIDTVTQKKFWTPKIQDIRAWCGLPLAGGGGDQDGRVLAVDVLDGTGIRWR